MAVIIFESRVNMITVPNPVVGGFIIAYDTADGLLKQKDSNGVITLISGSGSVAPLSNVLLNGNNTGTSSILMDSGTYIQSNISGGQIKLDNGLLDSNVVNISTDGGGFLESYLNMNSTNINLKNYTDSGLSISQISTLLQYNNNNKVNLSANTYTLTLNNNKVIDFNTTIPTTGNRLSGVISSENSYYNSSLINNSLILGGNNITATQSNTVYTPNLFLSTGIIGNTMNRSKIKFTSNNEIILDNNINGRIGIISSTSSTSSINGIFLLDTNTSFTSPNTSYGVIHIGTKNTNNYAGLQNTVVIGGTNLSASASNTVYLGGTVNINNNFNLPLDDGGSGQYITTDGSGNLSWNSLPNITGGVSIFLTRSEFIALTSYVANTTYIIMNVEPSLYGGTEIYLTTNSNGVLNTNGLGKFYNPKYNKTTPGFDIYNHIRAYSQNDVVFWGGYAWKNNGGQSVIDPINLYTLSTEWTRIEYTDLNVNMYYNIVYDNIIYDVVNDRIIYRNERNTNIVSTTFTNISYLISSLGLSNPIKAFQWGNIYNHGEFNGNGNQHIINSYNENINFTGVRQYNLSLDNSILINQSPTASYNVTTYQTNLTLSNSSQTNLILNYNQVNLTLDNYQYDRSVDIMTADETNLRKFGGSTILNSLTIPLGASAGYVLTSDMSGLSYWTASTGYDITAVHKTGDEIIIGKKNFNDDSTNSTAIQSVKNNISGILVDIKTGISNAGGTLLNVSSTTGDYSTNTAKLLVLNSGSASVGTPFSVQNNGVDTLTINKLGDISANKIIKTGGASTEYLMADGSVTIGGTLVDATTLIKGIVQLSGDLGGTADLPTTPTALHITGDESWIGVKSSINTATSSNGLLLINNNTSINSKIIDILNTNAGMGMLVTNTGTGSSIVSNVTTASTGFNYVGQNNGSNTFTVNKLGDITANKFIKTGGTSSQYLMADGSVTSGVSVPDASTSVKGIVQLTGDLGGTATAPTTPTAVHLTGNETINGIKNFQANTTNPSIDVYKSSTTGSGVRIQTSASNSGGTLLEINTTTGNSATNTAKLILLNAGSLSIGTPFTVQNNSVDTLTINKLGDITANKFIKTGGTSSQYLMADGSVTTSIVADATTSVKGIIQLTGDLGGTATAPTTPTALHITGNETFTGIKTATNTTSTQTNGITLINTSNNSNSNVLLVNTTTGGVGIKTDNSASNNGSGIESVNSATNGYAIRVINNGLGTGLFALNTGNGNAIQANSLTGSTGFNYLGLNNGVTTFSVNKEGNVTALSFIKTGGTSAQYLMADGSVTTGTSVDASTTVKGIVQLTGDLGGTATAPTTPTALHKTTNETFIGIKDATNTALGIAGLKITQTSAAASNTGAVELIKTSSSSPVLSIVNSGSTGVGAIYLNTTDVQGGTLNGTFNSVASSILLLSVAGTNTGAAAIDATSNGAMSTIIARQGASGTGNNFVGYNNVTLTFKVDKLGNATANSFIKTGGTSAQYLMADGTVTTGVVSPDATTTTKGIVQLTGDLGGTATAPTTPTALHKTTNETFTGIKTATNTGTTQINGFSLSNSGTNFSTVLAITNSSTGYGLTLNNTAGGNGLNISNSSTGNGIYLATNNTGTGMYIYNANSGYGMRLDNISVGQGVYLTNQSSGDGFRAINTSSGKGFRVDNSSTGYGFYSSNTVTGYGIYSVNSNSGYGIASANSANGIGIYSQNQSSGKGVQLDNTATGISLYVTNSSTGDALVISNSGTGFSFIGQNSAVTTFTINKLGVATGTSFVKSGGTSAQFLKADGSVDSVVYAPLASPTLTGTPTAPTATVGTNTTQIATTAFVLANGGLDTTALHKTGNETFTGTKTGMNSGTASGGIVLNQTSSTNSAFGVLHITKNTSNSNGLSIVGSGGGNGSALSVQCTETIGSNFEGVYNSLHGTTVQIDATGSAGGGSALKVNTFGAMPAIKINSSSTGINLVSQNNGTNTLTIDKLGNVTGNSFIKTGGLSTQYLMADGSITTRPYKVQTYLVNQSGTAIPTSTFLENGTGVGAPVWERNGVGDYRFLVGTVNSAKFFPTILTGRDIDSANNIDITCRIQGQYIQILKKTAGVFTDSLFNILLEVRIYP